MTADSAPSGEGGFLAGLRARASAANHALVFPEGDDERVVAAAAEGVSKGLFRPVLFGDPGAVAEALAATGADPARVIVHDPRAPERIERFGAVLHELRRARGSTEEEAMELVRDPLLQASLMVRLGEADGSVSGCVRTTADVIRAGIRGVGLAEGIETVSSSFYMVLPDDGPAGGGVLTFTDAGVVPEPTPRQLAEIAIAAARARRAIVGDEPRVAFLSFSTLGSAEGPAVEAVREAVGIFRTAMPAVPADGEMQGDAALDPEVAARKAPGSPVAGGANVLVFPDLSSANIAYKLVQRLAGAVALGPILQGLGGPCNDLSRGATASDVVSVACITSVMAG